MTVTRIQSLHSIVCIHSRRTEMGLYRPRRRKRLERVSFFCTCLLVTLFATKFSKAHAQSCVADSSADLASQSEIICSLKAYITLNASCNAHVVEQIQLPFWSGSFNRFVAVPKFQSIRKDSVSMTRLPVNDLQSGDTSFLSVIAKLVDFAEQTVAEKGKEHINYSMDFKTEESAIATEAAQTWILKYTVENAVQLNGDCPGRFDAFTRTSKNNMVTYWKPERASVRRIDETTALFLARKGNAGRYIEFGLKYNKDDSYEEATKYESGDMEGVSMTMLRAFGDDLSSAEFAVYHGDFESDVDKLKCKQTEDCSSQAYINNPNGSDDGGPSKYLGKKETISSGMLAGIGGGVGGVVFIFFIAFLGKKAKDKKAQEKKDKMRLQRDIENGGPGSLAFKVNENRVSEISGVIASARSPGEDDEEFTTAGAAGNTGDDLESLRKAMSPKECQRIDFTNETLNQKVLGQGNSPRRQKENARAFAESRKVEKMLSPKDLLRQDFEATTLEPSKGQPISPGGQSSKTEKEFLQKAKAKIPLSPRKRSQAKP